MAVKKIFKVLGYNPWNFDAQPGDIMVDRSTGKAWRLYERKGGPSAAAGELQMYPLKKPGFRATIQNGQLVWISEENL